MHFTKSLFVCASFVAAALAQSPIRFTQTPSAATVGVPTTLQWTGGDGSSTITIDLKQNGNKVTTILQRNGQATSFDYTPPSAGSNFVLTISQGSASSDSAPFSVTAASSSSSAMYSMPLSTSSALPASSSGAIMTSTVVASVTKTVVSVGTGSPSMPGNATFVSQTLSTASPTRAGNASGSGLSGGAGGPSTSSTSIPTGAASAFGTSVFLAVGAFAAIVCLN